MLPLAHSKDNIVLPATKHGWRNESQQAEYRREHDPANNFHDRIDPEFLGAVPTWHRAIGGGTHVDADALDRVEADALFAGALAEEARR